jgi:hypothetical protein
MTVITRHLIQQLQKKVSAREDSCPAVLGGREPALFFRTRSRQGRWARITRAASCCLLLLALLPLRPVAVEGAAVPVRFSEGMVRGFLVLHDSGGRRLASGDFLQVSRDGGIRSRTVLHFKDGSLHDETAVFTQQRSFVLKSYRLLQKGPSFRDEMDVSLERASGAYRVKVKPQGGKEKVLTGKLNLPPDVYNGMVPIVVKNLPKGAKETVHMVAFTPTPRVIELEVTPSVEDRVQVGDLKKSALHYVLKPKLGMLKIPAMVVGQLPPDNHLWIMTSEVPAFVRFQGPLAPGGPIWVIELASPVWGK